MDNRIGLDANERRHQHHTGRIEKEAADAIVGCTVSRRHGRTRSQNHIADRTRANRLSIA